jgi:hypothetical protein
VQSPPSPPYRGASRQWQVASNKWQVCALGTGN